MIKGQGGCHSLILITARQILNVLLDQQVGLDTHEDTNMPEDEGGATERQEQHTCTF